MIPEVQRLSSSYAVAKNEGTQVKEQTPLRHAPCTVASFLKHVSRLRSCVGRSATVAGPRCSTLAALLACTPCGRPPFARQSFASATPFVVKSTACRSLLLPASGQPRPQTLPVSFVPHSTPGQARYAPAGVGVWRHSCACGDLKKKMPTPASA